MLLNMWSYIQIIYTNVNYYVLHNLLCYRLCSSGISHRRCIAFAGFFMMLTCFNVNQNLLPRTVPFHLIKLSNISPATTPFIAVNHTHMVVIFTLPWPVLSALTFSSSFLSTWLLHVGKSWLMKLDLCRWKCELLICTWSSTNLFIAQRQVCSAKGLDDMADSHPPLFFSMSE